MDLQIKDHVAIVTGGGRGLGHAISRALGAEGARVVVWDRDDTAEQAAAEVRAEGGTAYGVSGDVTQDAVVREIVAATVERWGSIEILINCAGFSRDAPIAEMSDTEWHSVIDVCLNAPFYVCRAVAPYMIGAQYGRIVNISSRARDGDFNKVNYCSAKAGIVGLTYALAMELGKNGITCNAIAPGFCETERARGLPYYKDLKARALEKTYTSRLGVPEDIAAATLYLVSRESGYLSGEVLEVSGGRWR
jgi:3-oxoacyl-[acyl-carrier protein] reductase